MEYEDFAYIRQTGNKQNPSLCVALDKRAAEKVGMKVGDRVRVRLEKEVLK